MKLLRFYLLLFMLISSSSFSFANQEEASFGLQQQTLEWEKLDFERWIERKLTEDIVQFVPAHLFKIYADVTFLPKKGLKREVSNVNLSKFGTVVTVSKTIRANPKKGLFGRVQKLNLTFVADYSIPTETLDIILKLVKERIPIVEKEKIVVNYHRIIVPGKGIAGWVTELKVPLTLIFLTLLFCGLIIYLTRNLEWTGNVSIKPVERAQNLNPLFRTLPHNDIIDIPLQELADQTVAADAVKSLVENPSEEVASVSEEMKIHTLYNDSQLSISLRRVQSGFLGLSVEQCANIAKTNIDLAAIMEMVIPPSKTSKVFALLSDQRKQEIKQCSLKWNEQLISENVDMILGEVKKFRAKKNKINHSVQQSMVTYIEQVGPFEEDDIYNELMKSGDFDGLKDVAYEVVPASCIPNVPAHFLITPFMRLPYQDRIALIYDFSKNTKFDFSNKILEAIKIQQPQNFSAYKARINYYKNQDNEIVKKQQAKTAWINFVQMFRQSYRTNERIRHGSKQSISYWLFEKTGGVLGEADDKKIA